MNIPVPDDEWAVNRQHVVKVVMRGQESSTLPPDVFVNALFENGVLMNNDCENVIITIPHNNRKRFVYGEVFYTHRQEFSITYNQETISFLLLDPYDSRVQVTLLHMPVETTERAIRFIFNAINKDFCVSEVRVAPGKQRRHDRWQLMVECENVNDIPHCFILPNMGPKYEDLKIKVFVEGRKPLRDTSAPLPLHQVGAQKEDNQENTTFPNSATDALAQPAVIDDTKEKGTGSQATPALQNHPSTHTPSARPRARPTPSPNEVQPNLKKNETSGQIRQLKPCP